MAWVNVEEDAGPWDWVTYGVALVAGAAVWWWLGICAGLLVYIVLALAYTLAREQWLQAKLPPDAQHAAQRVLEWFRERFPDEQASGAAVRAVEPGRFVIAVYYGFGRPTPRRYFAISRPESADITELPVWDWWPRGLK